ncbi:MAG TPA: hypothetical protein VGD91_12025 [Trebonia sp.]
MSRAWTLAAIAAVAIGAGLTAQAASASASPPSPAKTWHLEATVDQSSGLNNQGVPGGLGKRGTLHAALRAKHPRGPVVGAVELELEVTSTTYPSTILQLGTIQLHGGTLAVQGVQAENQQTAELAVTGGTGSYTGAAGTVQVGGDGSVTINLASP